MADVSDSTLLDIAKGLNIYYSIFLIVLGTVCNSLSIVILSRKAYNRTTFSIYFRYLAVVDLLTLYNGLSRHFIANAFDYKIRHSNEIFCKVHQWTTATSPDISAWILVAMTIERVFSIIRPMKVRAWFSPRNVGLMLLVISLSLLALNIPLLINYGDLVVEKSGVKVVEKCQMNRPEMDYFMSHVWYWIDITKFVLLPSFILAVLNAVIILTVARSRKRLEKFNDITVGRGNNEVTRRTADHQKETSLTATLLVVNLTFIVLNSPISLYLIGQEYWFPEGFKPEEKLVYTCCIMAMYTNNAANFLLYCATGSKFRAEIGHLLSCSRRKTGGRNRYSLPPSTSGNRQTVASVA